MTKSVPYGFRMPNIYSLSQYGVYKFGLCQLVNEPGRIDLYSPLLAPESEAEKEARKYLIEEEE